MTTEVRLQQPVETNEPSLGHVQAWALPADEDSLWMLCKDIFQKHWDEIVFGSLIPGAVWEIRAPNAPTKVSVLDGYLTVDFGAWHFHICIGHFKGASDEDAFLRRTGRAELYRVLNKEGTPKSWGVRLFNNAGQQQMTVFLPNPFLTPEQQIAPAPDWSRLVIWDWLRETYLGLPSDPADRSGRGFSCGG